MGKRKLIVTTVVLALVGASAGAYYKYRQTEPPPTVTAARVVRGDIADTVGATGTLQAVTTVQVGTQVSGTIQELHADFNSIVHKGQVLARLDPSLFQTQIEQARANLIRAQADLERLRVSVADTQTKLARALELSKKGLIPQTDLEAAQVNVQSAQAQLKSQEAQVTQAQASLNQNQVNLQHTIIEAPIDGLVISRNVDVGQTVAASMQAPTLFVLAADLTKMQVLASLDESDVGRIRPGQVVHFRVDAYPTDDFIGAVTQVRLQPQTVQNVVTYSTVIDVPNPELKLKPGMTANVTVEIARVTNVLRVPNAALRFRPTNEIFAALKQTPPAGAAGGDGGVGGRGNGGRNQSAAPVNPSSQSAAPASPARETAASASPARESSTPASQAQTSTARRSRPPATEGSPEASATPTASGGRGVDGFRNGGESGRGGFSGAGAANEAEAGGAAGRPGGRGNFMERLQALPPDQREEMLARMRARGFDPTVGRAAPETVPGSQPSASRGRGQQPGQQQRPTAPQRAGSAGATTIDALFGPLPAVESVGRVWLYVDGTLSPVRVRLGISDSQATQLLDNSLQEGTEVVTSVATGAARPTAAAAGGAAFPFLGGGGRGGFPGGAGRGGGR